MGIYEAKFYQLSTYIFQFQEQELLATNEIINQVKFYVICESTYVRWEKGLPVCDNDNKLWDEQILLLLQIEWE